MNYIDLFWRGKRFTHDQGTSYSCFCILFESILRVSCVIKVGIIIQPGGECICQNPGFHKVLIHHVSFFTVNSPDSLRAKPDQLAGLGKCIVTSLGMIVKCQTDLVRDLFQFFHGLALEWMIYQIRVWDLIDLTPGFYL